MFTFLRRIRKSLIQSSALNKYVFYALGEILLVVLGILIALQVNNRNEERKLRKSEDIYIQRLSEDINNMIDASKFFNQKNDFLKEALMALRAVENCLTDSLNQKALLNTLSSHQVLSLFPIERKTYDEMLSIGMTAQLSNDSLKIILSDLYSIIEDAQNKIEYFRTELGRASEVIMRYVQFTVPDNKSRGDMIVAALNFQSLCNNLEFRNALVEVYDARSDVLSGTSWIVEKLEKVSKVLDQELSK